MNAVPEMSAPVMDDAKPVQPFPNSQKIYVGGRRPDIRVPMREIRQSQSKHATEAFDNPPITVYDTSGPYTDPDFNPDLRKGLSALRGVWIAER
ncbi:MAG: phosphomethylpyrimidine synthase ThiC, partial [Gammaproteobacteria bacterium]